MLTFFCGPGPQHVVEISGAPNRGPFWVGGCDVMW